MGPERGRRVRDAGRAVRAAVVDDTQFPVGRGHHRVRRRQQRVQSGVRPRRRRGGELRVAIGLEQVAGQGLRVLPPRRARQHQLLQQGARPSEASTRAARLRWRVRRPGDAALAVQRAQSDVLLLVVRGLPEQDRRGALDRHHPHAGDDGRQFLAMARRQRQSHSDLRPGDHPREPERPRVHPRSASLAT